MNERKHAVGPAGSALALLLALWAGAASAEGPEALLAELSAYPHAVEVAETEAQVIDHEVGLGALEKVRGSWRFKHSERLSGLLQRYTWQIVDGFSSEEVLEELETRLAQRPDAQLLFSCDGRACGHPSQWASRVFRERVLYGRQDLQRYRVYALQEADTAYRAVVYGSARTADRQYLHVELLRLAPAEPDPA